MSGGRHRNPGLSRQARITVLVVIMMAAAGGLVAWRMLGTGPCSGDLRLRVLAAPELADVLDEAAQEWAQTARSGRNECVQVQVLAQAPADVALGVASANGVVLPGLTTLPTPTPTVTSTATPTETPSGTDASTATPTAPTASPSVTAGPPAVATQPFDVWVPDSTTWLVRLRAAAPNLVPERGEPIASSPVVLAMPEVAAKQLGWPTELPTWSSVLQLVIGSDAVKLGIVEPNRDAAGLASFIALGAAAASLGPQADEVTVGITRALFAGRAPDESKLLARFPRSTDPEELAQAMGAAPVAERSVVVYNATEPEVRLAALYVQPAPAALDYPYAIMPGISAERARLAAELRNALSGQRFAEALGSVGLRGPDGVATFPALPGSPQTINIGQPEVAVVARALTGWISFTRPARMLAVVDVSGSMAIRVPGAGGLTRADIAFEAARRGVGLMDDSWQVGLWTFSTNLANGLDYQELLPIAPLAEQRDELLRAIETVRPKPGGGTGLYDTVLAAYKTVQNGYDPNYVNSVVVLTDGRNEDPNSITLDQLVASLEAIIDPRYPIQVIVIGFGDDVYKPELDRITSVTGGGAFIARTPSEIGQIFNEALSMRPPA